jgi:hypothetical protein
MMAHGNLVMKDIGMAENVKNAPANFQRICTTVQMMVK